MPSRHRRPFESGPQGFEDAPHRDRGSRRRLKRLRWQEHTTVAFWIAVFLAVFFLTVAYPWLLRQAPIKHRAFPAHRHGL